MLSRFRDPSKPARRAGHEQLIISVRLESGANKDVSAIPITQAAAAERG